jgi:hypothetical protein
MTIEPLPTASSGEADGAAEIEATAQSATTTLEQLQSLSFTSYLPE